jgi:hypothetical protein
MTAAELAGPAAMTIIGHRLIAQVSRMIINMFATQFQRHPHNTQIYEAGEPRQWA